MISKQQPRGIALMIVLIVVAVATVLAFALVGSQSTLAQASSNGVKALQADALAESGLQLAAYYLQEPTEAPVLNADGYYPGQTGISFGSGVEGTVDISVVRVSTNTYDIACTARSGSGSTLQRTVSARASVGYAYRAPDAISIANSINVYSFMTLNGSLRSSGTVTVSSGGKVNGAIYAPTITGSLLNVMSTVVGPVTDISLAAPPTIKDYKTYKFRQQTYSAQELKDTDSVIGPTANNPMGIYYTTSTLDLRRNLTLEGTLIVGGRFRVNTSNVTIRAQPGMPALLVYLETEFVGGNRNLDVTGLSWLKNGIIKSGIGMNNKANFVGAVQFPGTAAVTSSLGGTVTVTYDRSKVSIPNFAVGGDTVPYAVKLTSFNSSVSN